MKRTAQQSQLISSFFDLKDNLDVQQNNLMKIEEIYNLTISPPPIVLSELCKYFKETDFVELSNLSDPDEINKAREVIERHWNDLEEFAQKLETLEIKLKQYLSVKQGFNKDEELVELKNMVKYLSKTHVQNQNKVLLEIKEVMSESSNDEDDDRDNTQEIGIDEMANFCEMRIQEVVVNFHNSLGEEGSKFVEDIRKDVEPDLLLVLENQNDQEFLKEAEINDTKMDKLETDLRDLQKTEKKLKNEYSKWEKYLALDDKRKPAGISLSRYELAKKLDKLGGLKRQWSDSGLYARDHRLELANDKKSKFVSNTLLLQEIMLDKKEQLAFAKWSFKTEIQNNYAHLKQIFKKADECATTDISSVEQRLDSIKNKQLKDGAIEFIDEYKRMKEDKLRVQSSNREVKEDVKLSFGDVAAKHSKLLEDLKTRMAAIV